MAEVLENTPAAALTRSTTKSRDLVKDWMAGLPSITEDKPAAIAPSTPVEAPAAPTPSTTTPEPAKAPETKPAPAMVPSENEEEKWPRDAKDWDKFKAKRREKEAQLVSERETIKAERDKLSSEIAELKKSGPSPELEQFKKERDELSERLRMADIERHPRFKQYYDGKTSEQIGLARAIVGKDLADQVSTLLQMPDSEFRTERINELVGNLSVMQQSRIGSVLNSLEQINSERASEIVKAKTDFEKVSTFEKQRQEQAQQESIQKAQSVFDSFVKSAQDPQTGLMTFQKKDGDSAWNNEVEARVQSARELLFGKASPETMIQAAIRAVSLPAVLTSHKAALDKIATLESQVKALTASTPGGGGSSAEQRTNGAAAEQRQDNLGKGRATSAKAAAVDWMASLNKTMQSGANLSE